jgi:hypothetical protein
VPPVPSACQALADQVTTLEQQYTTLAAQTAGEVGPPAWVDLGRLGAIRLQLLDARAELDDCVRTHSAALTGTVAVIEASGGPPALGAQTVTLWDLTASGPVVREQAQVQSGAFGFQGPLPAQAAVTVQTDVGSDTFITGIDFRSGLLPGPLAGQTRRIELVVGPQLTLPTASIQAWAKSVAAVTQPLNAPALQLELSAVVSSITVALAAGSITVSAAGSVSGAAAGGAIAVAPTPVSASVPLSLQPSGSPLGDDIISVTVAGNVTVQASGALQAVGAIVGLLQGFAGDLIRNALHDWLHQQLPAFLAQGLALAELPAGAAVSLRSLTVDERGIQLQPVLGVIGTALTTFQPSPLPPP